VHHSRRIPLHLELPGSERPLFSNQDIEVIVCGVQPRVALRPEWGAKDNEIFGDAGMDDVHCAHRAARVIEHPLSRVDVDFDSVGRVGEREVGDNVLDHAGSVGGRRRGRDGRLRELVQFGRVEDIPSVLDAVQKPANSDHEENKSHPRSPHSEKMLRFLGVLSGVHGHDENSTGKRHWQVTSKFTTIAVEDCAQ